MRCAYGADHTAKVCCAAHVQKKKREAAAEEAHAAEEAPKKKVTRLCGGPCGHARDRLPASVGEAYCAMPTTTTAACAEEEEGGGMRRAGAAAAPGLGSGVERGAAIARSFWRTTGQQRSGRFSWRVKWGHRRASRMCVSTFRLGRRSSKQNTHKRSTHNSADGSRKVSVQLHTRRLRMHLAALAVAPAGAWLPSLLVSLRHGLLLALRVSATARPCCWPPCRESVLHRGPTLQQRCLALLQHSRRPFTQAARSPPR